MHGVLMLICTSKQCLAAGIPCSQVEVGVSGRWVQKQHMSTSVFLWLTSHQCLVNCVPCMQGLEFIADNKEEQSRSLHANVSTVNDELQGIVSSLNAGVHACWPGGLQDSPSWCRALRTATVVCGDPSRACMSMQWMEWNDSLPHPACPLHHSVSRVVLGKLPYCACNVTSGGHDSCSAWLADPSHAHATRYCCVPDCLPGRSAPGKYIDAESDAEDVVADLEASLHHISGLGEALAMYNQYLTLFDAASDDLSNLMLAEKEANNRYQVWLCVMA